MKRLILVAALLLIGCGGLDGQSIHYLRESQAFQVNLTMYQRKLKEVAAVDPSRRREAAQALLAEVEGEHKKLAALEPNPKVMTVHKELDALYTTMENFIKATLTGSGDSKDPRVGQLSKEWADHLDKLNREFQRLDH
ncbi:hypothetical protein JST97_14230 [bacterium]|nr:hypothetical protein [bacterium]